MQNNLTHAPLLLLSILLLTGNSCFAATPIIEIEIRNHLFFPDTIEILADTKVKLRIHNQDPSSEEFESYELNREKVIPGNSSATIFVALCILVNTHFSVSSSRKQPKAK